MLHFYFLRFCFWSLFNNRPFGQTARKLAIHNLSAEWCCIIMYFSDTSACFCRDSPPVGQGLLIHEVSKITHNDAPQSVELLWTNDKLVAKTSTSRHTIFTTDKHPCPRCNSNPQSQQASGRRPTP